MALEIAQARAPAETGQCRNAEVRDTIRAHHAELAAQLGDRTRALLGTTQQGDYSVAKTHLHDGYRTELIPQALAGERTLYSAAAEVESSKLLVEGMIAEHHALISLIADTGPAACFHIVVGTGTVLVDDEEIPVSASTTVVCRVVPRRAGDDALVFLGSLGDPAAEVERA